jgi:nucleoside phosphorylase
MLLSPELRAAGRAQASEVVVDYSNQPWSRKRVPEFRSVSLESLKEQPSLLLLTATAVERDAVLKELTPLDESGDLLKVFHGNNTYFVGRFGALTAVVCMCEMGSIGRDASYAVASDSFQLWRPAATIVLGIAFGRDSEKQKIGDVLVADRIIAYEPQRLGAHAATQRGQHFSSSATLLNRFRNVTDWQFADPNGVPCDIHFGPVLSGEKLVDDPDFKSGLFDKFGHAIGGEMEGAGVASCAERQKCDWILVKGICDWADGSKTSESQGFAAAAAVDLARSVFAESGVLPKS